MRIHTLRPAMAFLLVGALAQATVICTRPAHADVNITISNQGSQNPGGTAVPVFFTDLTVLLKDNTILPLVVPGDSNNRWIYPGRQKGDPRGPYEISLQGINADDIALVTPSRGTRTRKDEPAGGILRPNVTQLASIPELDNPAGNLLAVIIDGRLPHNLPATGTTLAFTNGQNSSVPDWFVPTSFNEATMTYSGAYTGSATVELPVIGVQLSPVPEPSTLVLALGAALGLVGYRRLARLFGHGKRAVFPAASEITPGDRVPAADPTIGVRPRRWVIGVDVLVAGRAAEAS
jgi:hypothetical protein